MSRIDTLELKPRGNVTKSYDFGINKIEFENGIQQYQRKYVTPRLSISFTTQGNKKAKEYLENFFLSHFGNHQPFYWEYEGQKSVYRFADSNIQFTEIRGYEGEGTVGYEAEIALMQCKESEY